MTSVLLTNGVACIAARSNKMTASPPPSLLLPVDCSRPGPMNNVNIVWSSAAHQRQGTQTRPTGLQDPTLLGQRFDTARYSTELICCCPWRVIYVTFKSLPFKPLGSFQDLNEMIYLIFGDSNWVKWLSTFCIILTKVVNSQFGEFCSFPLFDRFEQNKTKRKKLSLLFNKLPFT